MSTPQMMAMPLVSAHVQSKSCLTEEINETDQIKDKKWKWKEYTLM